MTEVTFTLREAIPQDARGLVQLSKRVSQETDFLIIDSRGRALSIERLAEELAMIYESPNNYLLLAFSDEQAIGAASIRATDEPRTNHIGEVGIFIAKDYWGFGLGTLMLEELLVLAKESQLLARLELTVQCRNQRAIQLYEKIGFITEGILKRGAKTADGDYIDTQLMRFLIDE